MASEEEVAEGEAENKVEDASDGHDFNDDTNNVPMNVMPKPHPHPALKLTDMPASNLALHSPSEQIVGTPFAIGSPPFEYPFPEPNATGPIASGSGSDSPPPPGPISALSLYSSASQSSLPSTSPAASFAIPSSNPPQSNYSPTHPKLLRSVSPPVPPGLVKKRQRWSLGLLGRRKSTKTSDKGHEIAASIDSFMEHQDQTTPGTGGSRSGASR
ncbi:hypothetical protein C8J56DRAFT_936445 [Mycena floridula]|nr:hypothetical protein C8J56DRAFT_936445 [Mycena floridula]